uniref:Uncharacterized protein n=1 Tax=Lygus hesperus TaxID=30085 RepID=A0A146LH48_LYGHE
MRWPVLHMSLQPRLQSSHIRATLSSSSALSSSPSLVQLQSLQQSQRGVVTVTPFYYKNASSTSTRSKSMSATSKRKRDTTLHDLQNVDSSPQLTPKSHKSSTHSSRATATAAATAVRLARESVTEKVHNPTAPLSSSKSKLLTPSSSTLSYRSQRKQTCKASRSSQAKL